ncbi:hypothetical protein RCL_jg1077.t1 [Rhizophagus clarus]|uniref:Uncharacterized protein n=1 Tax=Rhizophagus clarus TaxID=94130 RepID=A0A8H3M7L0_9GLOM|nr:hypothetical protein RCL_jg1077.t1 [Rhizophagus clarus]
MTCEPDGNLQVYLSVEFFFLFFLKFAKVKRDEMLLGKREFAVENSEVQSGSRDDGSMESYHLVVKAETLKISLAKNKEGVIEVIQTGSRDNGSMALYQLVVVLSRP